MSLDTPSSGIEALPTWEQLMDEFEALMFDLDLMSEFHPAELAVYREAGDIMIEFEFPGEGETLPELVFDGEIHRLESLQFNRSQQIKSCGWFDENQDGPADDRRILQAFVAWAHAFLAVHEDKQAEALEDRRKQRVEAVHRDMAQLILGRPFAGDASQDSVRVQSIFLPETLYLEPEQGAAGGLVEVDLKRLKRLLESDLRGSLSSRLFRDSNWFLEGLEYRPFGSDGCFLIRLNMVNLNARVPKVHRVFEAQDERIVLPEAGVAGASTVVGRSPDGRDNQDAFYLDATSGARQWAVADGVGGGSRGEAAAKAALCALEWSNMETGSSDQRLALLLALFKELVGSIIDEYSRTRASTTLVVATELGTSEECTHLQLDHIGDSGWTLWYPDGRVERSLDHTPLSVGLFGYDSSIKPFPPFSGLNDPKLYTEKSIRAFLDDPNVRRLISDADGRPFVGPFNADMALLREVYYRLLEGYRFERSILSTLKATKGPEDVRMSSAYFVCPSGTRFALYSDGASEVMHPSEMWDRYLQGGLGGFDSMFEEIKRRQLFLRALREGHQHGDIPRTLVGWDRDEEELWVSLGRVLRNGEHFLNLGDHATVVVGEL